MKPHSEQKDYQLLAVQQTIIRTYTNTTERTTNIKSPDLRSPDVKSIELVRYNTSTLLKETQSSVPLIALVLTAISMDILLRIPELAKQNGGWYFLIPLYSCLMLVVIPIVFIELALGQITGQNSTCLFDSMAPILAGLGYMMDMSRLINSITFYNAGYPMMFVGMVKQMFGFNKGTTCTRSGKYCYENETCSSISKQSQSNTLSNATVFFGNKCFDARNQSRSGDYHMIKHRLITTGAPTADTANLFGSHLDALCSVILYSCLVMSVVRNGSLSSSKFSLWTMVILLSSFIGFGLIQLHDCNVSVFQSFHLSLQSDASALLSLEVWSMAMNTAISLVRVGDGTMNFIGASLGFNNKNLKVACLVFVSSALLIPISFILVFLMNYNPSQEFSMSNSYEWSLPNQIVILHYDQPLTIMHNLVMLLIVGALLMSQLPYHAITSEVVHHRLTMIATLYTTTTRNVQKLISPTMYGMLLIAGYGSLSTFVMVEEVNHIIWNMFCPIVYVEMMVLIFHYGIYRLLVNVKTMFENGFNPISFSELPCHVLRIYLGFVVPICLLICSLAADYYSVFNILCDASLVYSLVLFCISVPLISALTRKVLFGHPTEPFFRIHGRWGPLNMNDRKRMEHDQRAARLNI